MEIHRVKPGSKLNLEKIDPRVTPGVGSKREAEKLFAPLNERLSELQNRLWAEHERKVLVVLQGMDTSGKDGTIQHVFRGLNPLGVTVAAFKVPSEEELAHDFLWRIHRRVPGKGQIAIFNRSHYEDVLAARVRHLVPKAVWKERYPQIVHFEELLAQTGTLILKFFLYISRDEQKERLEERLRDPEKRWKFRKADLEDRKLWDDYMRAYEEAIERTSRDDAPWYIVPADRKWYRNLVVAKTLVERLAALKVKRPEPAEDLTGVVVE
jgi:PPK2 family polyphosphate:nucleotide phosphotransferase